MNKLVSDSVVLVNAYQKIQDYTTNLPNIESAIRKYMNELKTAISSHQS